MNSKMTTNSYLSTTEPKNKHTHTHTHKKTRLLEHFMNLPPLLEYDAHMREETFIESKLFEQQRVILTVMRI